MQQAFAIPQLKPYLEKNPDSVVEVAVVLANDPMIQGLNASYRKQDKPTNVLSFPQEPLNPLEYVLPESVEGISMLGDIILAYETIDKEAKEEGKTLTDHIHHLVIHGLLHLLGYDHEDNDEAEIMENLEIQILQSQGIANPYEELGA
ncbi:MAG: rRNA maturation RNase YbeY [Alphaproteobacteria bacterium]|nr:rRNA maturation RNase YbeY [Alphaproteobacteria bacterium]